MKEGWTLRSFAECVNKIPKQRQVKSKDYLPSGLFPIVSQEKELISGYWNDEDFLYKHEKPIVIFGDHTKEIKFIDFDFVVGADGTQILYPKENIDTKFFYYALLATPLRTLGYARHFKLLKEKSFFIPDLPIQQRIAERLDAAFENIDKLKANAEKQLAEARILFQKSLAKAMKPKEGWEEKNIGELTDSCLGKMLDKQKNKGEYQPYLRNINVRWGEFDLSDILEMKFEDGEDERYGIQKGDLIICEGGEPGRCAIWEGKMENMKIQKALHRVRSKGEILNRYLYFSIMYYAQSGFLEKFESGATIKHLTGEALRKIPLSYPPLAEQQRIVERLDSLSENVRKYEEIQRQMISECDALKQALLRKVFE